MNTHYINPAHRPCPDLTCFSLTSEQKQKGMKHLTAIRKKLCRCKLEQLHEQYTNTPKNQRAKRSRIRQQAIQVKKKLDQLECVHD